MDNGLMYPCVNSLECLRGCFHSGLVECLHGYSIYDTVVSNIIFTPIIPSYT